VRLRDLPDGYPIEVDTETSKLYPDSGGRIAAVSYAYREPDPQGDPDPTQPLVWKAVAFDQGVDHLPLGDKPLDDRTMKRLSKWPDWALDEDAGNLPPERFVDLTKQFSRLRICWHNAKFDLSMFRAGLRGEEAGTAINLEDNTYWDTQLAQSVIDPREGIGLKPLAVRLHLGHELGVKEGMEDDEALALKPWLGPKTGKNADPRYDLVPWSIMGPYARMDAALTILLREQQWELLEEEYAFVMTHISREIDLMKVLYRMEGRGVGFDVDGALRMEKLIEEERQRVSATLPFEPTPNKARKYFFGERPEGLGHGLFEDKLTEKKREPQVDDEVITRLASEVWEGQEVAKVYQRHEALKSANSKWYGAWPYLAGPDGRLRTNHKQASVISGRLAVERIQLQAIPQPYQMPKVEGLVGVRDLFIETVVCPCGCGPLEMWEFDVSQAEIRIATAAARCRPMLEGFYRGDDSHSIATRLMFRELFDQDGYSEGEERHDMWEELRAVSKRCNLGILYGAGVKVIREQIMKFTGITYPMRQVGVWVNQWNAAFPEMGERLDTMSRMAQRQGFVKLVNGRQRWFSPYEDVHKAFNQEVQGSLAEVMKDVMIQTENEFPNALLLQIHDSVILRLSRCQIEAGARERVAKIMTNAFEEAFTFRWPDTGKLVRVPFRSDAKRFGRKEAV
jgi:DNA polymerase I-like protein with 3'-5' exonuclease and polymerase domains